MRRIAALLLVIAVVPGLFAQVSPHAEEILRGYGSLSQGGLEDVYEVTAPEDGTIVVVAVSPDFRPRISARTVGGPDRDGGGVDNVARLTLSVLRDDLVRIVVRDAGGAGDSGAAHYMVTARYSQVGSGIAVGTVLDGELDSGDDTDDGGSYVDRYDLAVPAGERVRIDLSSPEFDTYLRVELPDGRLLENDDSVGTDSSVSFTSGEAGVALVEVTSFGYGSTGAYRLEVLAIEQRPIRVGGSIRGELLGVADEYLLTGRPGDLVAIELESDDFDTYLELTDPSGIYLYNDDADGVWLSRLVYQLGSDGEATITVSSFGDSGGEYALRVQRYTYDGPHIPDGYRLSEGETVQGELGPHVPFSGGSYRQRFTFEAARGERVEIVLRSDDFDSFLTVVSPWGVEQSDDDSAGGLDSRVVLTADESGVYEVYASDLGGGAIGAYTLSFNRATSARLLLDTRGELIRGDRTDISGKYYDTYRFTVGAGRLVTIDVMSDDFDGYAIVRSRSGEILYRDDDGGGSGNPRISFTADRAQSLELVVTSFSEGATGAYTVTIYE